MEGVARQVTQPFVLCARVPLENTGAPLGAPPGQARAVRADLRAFSFRQRAVLFVGRSSVNGRPSASSWRAALIGRQTGPGAARVRACEARSAGAASCPTIRRL